MCLCVRINEKKFLKMRRIVSILLLFFSVQCVLGIYVQNNAAVAQTVDAKAADKLRKAEVKKLLDDAKVNLKQNKNLDKTEAAMRKLLLDSANIRDKRLHATLIEALRMQYNQGNEKLYLHQAYDTTQLFLIARKIFEAAARFDSIEALPNEKGKVEYSYRRDNAQLLSQLYGNLYTGSVFLLNHRKYQDAVQCVDTYLMAPEWPMMENALRVDSLYRQHASYVMLVAGYRSENFPMALKYESEALRYRPRLEPTLQYLAEIYNERKDSARYEQLLTQGMNAFPRNRYFFSRLVDFHCNRSDYEAALCVTTKALAADTADYGTKVIRQTLLLNLARYDECVALGDRLIAENDTVAEVYYNNALAYYNQTMGLDKGPSNKRKEREKQLQALYRKCRPYMEKFRELEPKERSKWRPVLYNVYLNLNMGKEFSEL